MAFDKNKNSAENGGWKDTSAQEDEFLDYNDELDEEQYQDEEAPYDENDADDGYDGTDGDYDDYDDADDDYDDADDDYDENELNALLDDTSDDDADDVYETETYGEEDDGAPGYDDDGSDLPTFVRLKRDGRFTFPRDPDENGDAEDEGTEEDEPFPTDENEGSIVDRLLAIGDNELLLTVLLILVPPLGLYLMWRGGKFDQTKRMMMSVVSVICFALIVVMLIPTGTKETITDPNEFSQFTAKPSQGLASSTAAPSSSAKTGTSTPSATPHASATTDLATEPVDTASAVTHVYATNAGKYYHTIEDCGGIQNATRLTLDVAQARSLDPCPDCAGGVSEYIVEETKYYATTKGTWYHTNPTCQSMTGAQIVKEADAIAAGKTACPVCIGYYGTDGGSWYHCISNCQGMVGAVSKPKEDWEKSGKTACPVCMSAEGHVKTNEIPTETMVWATTTGVYFHTKSDCSGMKNAAQGAISRAVSMNKKPCPTCVKPANIYVFATSGGKYYHTKNDCTGMKNPQYVTAAKAAQNGKTACPTCATMLGSSGGSTSVSTTNVYATKNGTYFHTEPKCSGMANASKYTYTKAVNEGKKACPECVKASKITVYATSDGKYFHTVSDCSGMKGATAFTAAKAISYDKSACPTCAKALKFSDSEASMFASAEPAQTFTSATVTAWTNTASAAQTVTAADPNSTVYIKLGSGDTQYYHLITRCSKLKDATAVTLNYAITHGYEACPSCNPPKQIIL